MIDVFARGLKPKDVREWDNDHWLFPYYTDPKMVPYGAREDQLEHLPKIISV